MKNSVKLTVVAMSMGLVLSAVARAGTIAQETFDVSGDFRDWEMTDWNIPDGGAQVAGSQAYGNFSVPAGFGNPTNALRVNVVTAPIYPTTETVRTDGGTLGSQFLGNYATATASLQFDFYMDLPTTGFNSLQLYFKNTTSGRTWFYNVDVSGQAYGTWHTYSIPFNTVSTWFDENGSNASFFSDITAITEIGFTIAYFTDTGDGASAGQVFGINNVRRASADVIVAPGTTFFFQ